MKEGIFRRLVRIIRTNLGGLTRSFIGDRSILVYERTVLEINDVLNKVRSELGKISVDKYYIEKQIVDKKKIYENMEIQIEKYISEDDFVLAEKLISKQIDIEKHLSEIERCFNEYLEREREIESYIRSVLERKKKVISEMIRIKKKGKKADEEIQLAHSSDEFINLGSYGNIFKRKISLEKAIGETAGSPSSEGLAELESMVRKVEIKNRLDLAIEKRKKGKHP